MDNEQTPRINSPEFRHNFLVPFLVISEGVTPADLHTTQNGIQDVIDVSGQERDIAMLGNGSLGEGQYTSGEWYVNRALEMQSLSRDMGYGPQVDFQKLWEIIQGDDIDGIQSGFPHVKILITSHDLTGKDSDGRYVNFGYGITDPGLFVSVLSFARFSEIEDPVLREKVLRNFVRHEASHLFGIPRREKNTEMKLGKHCINRGCTMNQSMSLKEANDQTLAIEAHGAHFCKDCIHDFEAIRDSFKKIPGNAE